MYQVDVDRHSDRPGADGDGHASPQTVVTFGPDGVHYATGSYDGRVILWARGDRTPRWVGQHSRLVNGVAFSPSGRFLASGGADKVCRVWDVADGSQVQLMSRQPDDLNALAWLEEDVLVTVSQDGTGRIWDVGAGQVREQVLVHSDHCMSIDCSPSGLLATCGEDAAIRIWDREGGLVRDIRRTAHAEMCRWSRDGSLLAASCDDGYVHVLRPDGENLTRVGPYEAAVKSVAWSRDGHLLAIGAYDNTVRLWRWADNTELVRWSGHHLWPRSLDFSADQRSILVGTVATRPELLDIPEELPAGPEPVTVVVEATTRTFGVNRVASAGPRLAAGCDDGVVRYWPATDARPVELPAGDGSLVNAVSVAGAGTTVIAYGNFAGQVGVLDPAAPGTGIATVRLGHPINCVSFSPDASVLAAADYEGTLQLYRWDGRTLEPGTRYAGHDGAIKDVCWVGDDRLVTVSTDRTARLLDSGGGELARFTGHGELINAASVTRIGDRTVLATASRDRTVRLYDLERGSLLGVLLGHDESVKAVAWRGDGSPVLLTGSYDFTGRIWTLDPDTWQVADVRVLGPHRNAISSVCWAGPDAVTAAWDARIVVWPGDGSDGTEIFPGGTPS